MNSARSSPTLSIFRDIRKYQRFDILSYWFRRGVNFHCGNTSIPMIFLVSFAPATPVPTNTSLRVIWNSRRKYYCHSRITINITSTVISTRVGVNKSTERRKTEVKRPFDSRAQTKNSFSSLVPVDFVWLSSELFQRYLGVIWKPRRKFTTAIKSLNNVIGAQERERRKGYQEQNKKSLSFRSPQIKMRLRSKNNWVPPLADCGILFFSLVLSSLEHHDITSRMRIRYKAESN